MGGISDWLDGWAAMRLGQQTSSGALLDPVCDKLFVLTHSKILTHGYASAQASADYLLIAEPIIE